MRMPISIICVIRSLLQGDAEDYGVGDVVDVEVVDGPVLEAVAIAQAQCGLTHLEVGTQVVGHVQAVAPPSQVGQILVVAEVDLVVALVILRSEKYACHGQLQLVSQRNGLAPQAGVEPGRARRTKIPVGPDGDGIVAVDGVIDYAGAQLRHGAGREAQPWVDYPHPGALHVEGNVAHEFVEVIVLGRVFDIVVVGAHTQLPQPPVAVDPARGLDGEAQVEPVISDGREVTVVHRRIAHIKHQHRLRLLPPSTQRAKNY